MNSITRYPVVGRVAGVLYLSIIACGLFSEVFVRGELIVNDDPITTVSNIKESALLYQSGFVADVLMLLCDAAVAGLFYCLFKSSSQMFAMLVAIFRMIQTAVLGMNLLNYYAPWLVINTVTDDLQQQSLIMLFLDLHRYGYDLGLIFFGISNVLLGVLFMRSVRLPVVLGIGLVATGLIYLTGSFTRFVTPQWVDLVQPSYVVAFVVETSLCIWLLSGGKRKSASVLSDDERNDCV
ncbi:DUF4386 domain-containing protein [Gynuella sp.]|uniref:DUF4386 domain-containing protein n=1 Tax=Gynuella sp. TaxID=2969146 RepID=UPI003D131735